VRRERDAIANQARRRNAFGVSSFAFGAVVAAIGVFLILPTVIVLPISLAAAEHLQFPPQSLSLRWYGAYFDSAAWTDPTVFSLQIAAIVAVASVIVGTSAAFGMVRGSLGRVRGVVSGFLLGPLIIPGIIYAIAVLLFFSPLRLSGTLAGFILAHGALALPYVVLVVSAALYRLDPDLELAAMGLGASRAAAVRHVTLPLIWPAVVIAGVFAFLTSFDEATVAFFISGVSDVTLPRKMFENVQFTVSPILAVVATLLTTVSLVLLGGSQALQVIVVRRQTGSSDARASTPGDDLESWRLVTTGVVDPTGKGVPPESPL